MRRLSRVMMLAMALSATGVLADEGGSIWRQPGALLDRSHQTRPQMLSFFLGLPYGYFGYGFPLGVSGRYLIPLAHDGFISTLNDSVNLEFGADLSAVFGTAFYPVIGIPVEGMWRFHLTQNFSVYAKVGLSLRITPVSYCSGFGCGVVWFDFIGNAGLAYKLGSSPISLRAEVGYPWTKVGIGIDM